MNDWWIAPVLRYSIRRSVRRELAGVWVRGQVPSPGAVLAPNHHSWWDGYLLGDLAASLGQPCAFLMNERQLARFPFLRLVGAASPGSVRSLSRLAREGHWVVVFPEGAIRPQGGVAQCSPGAAWVARQANVPLVPVALRVVMRGSQKPEGFIRFGTPCAGHELPGALNAVVSELDDDLRNADPDLPPAGYLRWVAGHGSRHDRADLPSRLLARLYGEKSEG